MAWRTRRAFGMLDEAENNACDEMKGRMRV